MCGELKLKVCYIEYLHSNFISQYIFTSMTNIYNILIIIKHVMPIGVLSGLTISIV